MSSGKILIICGPTATGKTTLAFRLAKIFSSQLISADSRQLYKRLDIGTGKDAPASKVLGYDLVAPDQDFSVSHFVAFAGQAINTAWQKNLLPIIIGGTGLYLNSLINPPPSLNIPPNPRLRHSLNKLSVTKLQAKLSKINPLVFKGLNRSDCKNPRRLIRAIEIADWQLQKGQLFPERTILKSDVLWVGLKAPLKILDQRINRRVINRINQGYSQEVKKLIKLYPDWSLPAFSATGYRLWKAYLEKRISKSAAISLWQLQERRYARRQLTWFNKNSHLNWFDITCKNYQLQVVELVKNWYSTINAASAKN